MDGRQEARHLLLGKHAPPETPTRSGQWFRLVEPEAVSWLPASAVRSHSHSRPAPA